MEEVLTQNARAYASRHQLELAERLGFGIHGIIHAAEDKAKSGNTALKAHRSVEPYLRERAAYERLREAVSRRYSASTFPSSSVRTTHCASSK